MSALQAEVVHPAELSPPDIDAWRAVQAAGPDFANPLLGPDFAAALGRVREDARVAVWRRDGAAVGFLAFHARPGGLARPIGAPFSDYHALACVPGAGLEAAQALAAAGIGAYRFSALIDPHGVFAGAAQADAQNEALLGHRIHLTGTPEAYWEVLRAASPKRFKNYRRLESKLEREVGALRLRASQSRADFDQVMAWKRAQFARTGVHDVLAAGWTRRLMDHLFEAGEGPMRGLLLTLHAGEDLVGGHFGVRAGGYAHPWIASMNPDLAAFGPGITFLSQVVQAMPDLGLCVYDLGPSHDHYKAPFANETVPTAQGLVLAAGRRAGPREGLWTLAGAGRSEGVARLRRRLDHIASVELSAAGRVRGLALAVASLSRREAARRSGADAGLS